MTEHKKTKIFKKKGGCNEECAHCPYPDCYKPSHQIKSDGEFISKKEKETMTSQGKMYTVCLGGYGGVRPNLSKKYYR